MSTIADTPEAIEAFGLLQLKARLKLESLGMKARGQSALSIVRQRFGIKARTAKAALPEYINLLKSKGILPDSVPAKREALLSNQNLSIVHIK